MHDCHAYHRKRVPITLLGRDIGGVVRSGIVVNREYTRSVIRMWTVRYHGEWIPIEQSV